MKLSLIVAALAALGGLTSQAAVDQALREAAPAAPERDFRSLIDMARQALNTQINSGRPSNDQVYVCIEAMYSDRVVVECSRCWGCRSTRRARPNNAWKAASACAKQPSSPRCTRLT